ncbi:unnamed protein product [Trichobilharzia regenti]|nr:unnamed protein product [Trichobilharzia regenti]
MSLFLLVSIHDWSLILYGTNTPPPSVPISSHRRGVRQLPRNQEPNLSVKTQKTWVNSQKDKSPPSKSVQQLQQKSIQTSKHFSFDSTVNPPSENSNNNNNNLDHSAFSLTENHNSYPYPPFYYLNNQNSYRYWPTWNNEYQGLSPIPAPPPLPPPPLPPAPAISVVPLPSSSSSSSASLSPSLSPSSSHGSHDVYAHYFPPSSIPFSSIDHSSSSSSSKNVLDQSNPSIDFDLPALVVQSNDFTHLKATSNTLNRNEYSEKKEIILSHDHEQYSVNQQESSIQQQQHHNNKIIMNSDKKVSFNCVSCVSINQLFIIISTVMLVCSLSIMYTKV